MDPVSVRDVAEELADGDDARYEEILRSDSMSLGVYRIPAGGTDPQDPHAEDEAYYVVSGAAKIAVGDDAYPVEPGDVVYVEREVDHHFFDVEEDLVVLVAFAPPEGSQEGSERFPLEGE